MQHKEGLFSGVEDLQLYYQCWLPRGTARAVVILVHGFSDHCGRYENLVDGLVRHRIAAYSYDLRGHGQSSGTRGYVQHFDNYRQDTRAFVDLVAKQHPGLPLFLYGHSMGGLIALDQALRYPERLNGVIASAPLLGNPPVATVKLIASRLLSKIWPSFSVPAGLDSGAISRDDTVVKAYQEDPLIHGRGTARLATELEEAIAQVQANAQHLKLPFFIYFGNADRLINPEDCLRFYNNVGSADKTITIYEGGYHENHNDIHRERVAIEVAQWVEAQILIASQQHEPQDQADG